MTNENEVVPLYAYIRIVYTYIRDVLSLVVRRG